MHPYATEEFTAQESDILRRYFTNLEGPVFALVNLPEVVKGALFARYSRTNKSLRRLFLDEFVSDLVLDGDESIDATIGLERADDLYQKVFFEYGDDSVAQLGGVHLACEQSSNVLTKILEWGRIMSYLEQSTRYLGYDKRLSHGFYRYYRDHEVLDSKIGARYVGDMDRIFDAYSDMLPKMVDFTTKKFPKTPEDTDFAYRQAIRAKSLDAVRGLLPASALSSVGIYGSGQAFEGLLLRMRANPLPESQHYSELMLTELRKVIPSFLKRVDLEDRGVAWTNYMAETKSQTAHLIRGMWDETAQEPGESVRLTGFDPEGETRILEAITFANSNRSTDEVRRLVESMDGAQRSALLETYIGRRGNRRHRPGRAFERTDYRFELVTDYGAFRDLQRHRMLTIEWQPLTAELGYDVPELIDEAGLAAEYRATMERSRDLYEAMVPDFPHQAQYAVSLAYRIRYVIQMNAREAMHLIELRSGPQGHPSYRRVAQEMHRQIADVAGHRAIADAMIYVDHGDIDLERLEAERAAERARSQR